MATILDPTPISVTRIRRSMRVEINYDSAGAVLSVIAHRWSVAQRAGVDATPPVYVGATTFLADVIPGAVKTQLLALATLIDNADTAPAQISPLALAQTASLSGKVDPKKPKK